MKIALAQINPIIGSLDGNCQKIIAAFLKARDEGAECVVFPELAVTGYPPEDLLLLPDFIKAAGHYIEKIIKYSEGIVVIVGCVRPNLGIGEKKLFNSAAIIQNGQLLGFHDKILLPDYDVFSERRYFEPGKEMRTWELLGQKVGISVCEDVWQHAGAVEYSFYPRDPIQELNTHNPQLLINLSASPYYLGRHKTRFRVGCKAVETLKCPYVQCNQVGGNDSLIFDGYSFYIDRKGDIALHAKGFEEQILHIDTEKVYPQVKVDEDEVVDLLSALILGIRDYFHKLGWKKACLGLSGGVDSAVVAVIAARALGPDNILALSLPSRYSSPEGRRDALQLATTLGIKFHEISIDDTFNMYLETLNPYFAEREPDITEENLQARIRGTLLMAFANKFGYLLLCTGNKSEMAMGYTTLYGDMCGALAVLSDVTKAQVYALASLINKEHPMIPPAIISKVPSAELKFDQKDSDTLPIYPIVDAVLEDYVENHLTIEAIATTRKLPLQLVKDLVRKIHLNEYKRRQAPPGLRVTKKAFSVGRRFPIVQHWNI